MKIQKKEEVIKTIPNNTVNKGFTQIGDCITMCYDLTTDEKVLYTFILKNYNDKIGYSFPSWHYMKFVLNRGDGKINDTLNGLEEKGLIYRKKIRGKNNRYYLNPLNQVPCIALSEATFQFVKQASELDLNVWEFVKVAIKSERYSYFKENFVAHKNDKIRTPDDLLRLRLRINEGGAVERCTTDEYLLYLQQTVEKATGEKVPLNI